MRGVVRQAESLKLMVYSGRSLGMGSTPEGAPLVTYGLTGRSKSSQARRLVLEPKDNCFVMATRPTDESVLRQGYTALLLYNVMKATARRVTVGNGAQTDIDFESDLPLQEALARPVHIGDINITSYEPDKPNYTPRITGRIDLDGRRTSFFHSVRKEDGSDDPIPEPYEYELVPGVARTIATYAGGNEPDRLQPFAGPPIETKITANGARELCAELFDALRGAGPDFRVSAAAVVFLPMQWGYMADYAIHNVADGDELQTGQFPLKLV